MLLTLIANILLFFPKLPLHVPLFIKRGAYDLKFIGSYDLSLNQQFREVEFFLQNTNNKVHKRIFLYMWHPCYKKFSTDRQKFLTILVGLHAILINFYYLNLF